MAHRDRLLSPTIASAINELGRLVGILECDPQVLGSGGNGECCLPLRLTNPPINMLLEFIKHMGVPASSPEAASDTAAEQRARAADAARVVLAELPALCEHLLRLTACVVRWPAAVGAAQPSNSLNYEPVCVVDAAAAAAAAAHFNSPAEARRKLRQLCSLSLQLLSHLQQHGPLEHSCRLAHSLVRMHTLQACSRSLVEAVARLMGSADGAAANDPQGFAGGNEDPPTPPSPGVGGMGPRLPTMELLEATQRSVEVLQGLSCLIRRIGNANGAGRAGAPAGGNSSSSSRPTAMGTHCAALVTLLREVLPGSGLVEHLARGVLHLARADRCVAPDTLWVLLSALDSYAHLAVSMAAVPGLDRIRGAVLGGPWATSLATTAGLHVLCTAEGGPSYVAPQLLEGTAEHVWDLTWSGELAASDTLLAFVHGVSFSPLHSRTAVNLLHSVVRAVVASARLGASDLGGFGASGSGNCSSASAGGGGLGGSGGGSGGRRLPWHSPGVAEQAAALAALALLQSKLRVQHLSGARQRAAAEGWRLTTETVRHALQGADGATVRRLAELLSLEIELWPAGGTLSPRPPPALAAALAGGFLPCLERLVRRAGESSAAAGSSHAPGTAEQRLLVEVLRMGTSSRCLFWCLAYGDPPEAAALVVSLGKLLRATAASADGTLLAAPGQAAPPCPLAVHAVHAAALLLCEVYAWSEGGSARQQQADDGAAARAADAREAGSREGAAGDGAASSGAEGPSATGAQAGGDSPAGATGAAAAAAVAAAAADAAGVPPEAAPESPAGQLRRIALLAACEWLPALWTLVYDAAGKVQLPARGSQQAAAPRLTNQSAHVLRLCLGAFVEWLPMGLEGAWLENWVQGTGPAASSGSSGESASAALGGPQVPGPAGCMVGAARVRLLKQQVPAVLLLGGGMGLEAHMLSAGLLGTNKHEQAARIVFVYRLLFLSASLCLERPGEVTMAGAGDARGGFPCPCAWSSAVARQITASGDWPSGATLASALRTWEAGVCGDLERPALRSPGRLPIARLATGASMVEALEAEVQQPWPLRRCAWWRCTNLAGDSEAGLPLRACGACGGAWYCGRGCQIAHWREGHRDECGGRAGVQARAGAGMRGE